MSADPNGCRHCGVPEREHLQRWKPPVGWHVWAEPTQGQRKQRMLARRTFKNSNTAALDRAHNEGKRSR